MKELTTISIQLLKMTQTFVARTIKNMSRFARGVMLTTP